MIDKERLEDIKKELELDWSDISYVVNQDDVKWLINRVEELELEVNDWRDETIKWSKYFQESEESHLETKELLKNIVNQNKRYRKAINNIIEKVMLFGTNEEVYEAIQDAIKALEGDND
jgi:uncharacterized protein (UPF0335 family)